VTIRIGQDAHGHHSHTMKRARLPTVPVRRTETRQGIKRLPRDRVAGDLPLTEGQQAVYAAMGESVVSATALARAEGMSAAGVSSIMYRLADRGLVERVPGKGWRRT
jgi:predicted Rossmann fold nucleotide-binding protein DprA/Smf involved in DNA uptake